MAYIGNNPDAIQNSIEITRFNGNAACTQFQIPQDVDDAKAIEVLVNSVQQDPDNSYTVTNGLITFSEAPSVGTNNVTVLRRTGLTFTRTQIDSGDILPNAVTSAAIADGAVATVKLQALSVTTAKLATTGVSAGTYGGADQIPVIVVGVDGRVTSSSNVSASAPLPNILMLSGM